MALTFLHVSAHSLALEFIHLDLRGCWAWRERVPAPGTPSIAISWGEDSGLLVGPSKCQALWGAPGGKPAGPSVVLQAWVACLPTSRSFGVPVLIRGVWLKGGHTGSW